MGIQILNRGKRGKRGQILDLFYIPIVLLVFVLAVIFGWMLLDEFTAEVENDPQFNNTVVTTALASGQTIYSGFDWAIIVIMIAATLMMGISAFFIRSHPIFFVFSLLIWIMAIGNAAIIENVYETIEEA